MERRSYARCHCRRVAAKVRQIDKVSIMGANVASRSEKSHSIRVFEEDRNTLASHRRGQTDLSQNYNANCTADRNSISPLPRTTTANFLVLCSAAGYRVPEFFAVLTSVLAIALQLRGSDKCPIELYATGFTSDKKVETYHSLCKQSWSLWSLFLPTFHANCLIVNTRCRI